MEAFKSLDSGGLLTNEEENELANLTVDTVVEKEVLKDVCFIFKKKFVSAKVSINFDFRDYKFRLLLLLTLLCLSSLLLLIVTEVHFFRGVIRAKNP